MKEAVEVEEEEEEARHGIGYECSFRTRFWPRSGSTILDFFRLSFQFHSSRDFKFPYSMAQRDHCYKGGVFCIQGGDFVGLIRTHRLLFDLLRLMVLVVIVGVSVCGFEIHGAKR